jgi:rod shape-determining protein MreD
MNESSDQLLRSRRSTGTFFSRFPVAGLVALTLIAVVSKFYLPRLIPSSVWLEVPLLLTIYFGLMRPDPVPALLFGAFVGIAEDSLAPANLPIGMYGITKTLVGYFAASVSKRFNLENPLIRLMLCFFFYFFHEFFYWLMRRALLQQLVLFDPRETLLHGLFNIAFALPLYVVLDRMKVSEDSKGR